MRTLFLVNPSSGPGLGTKLLDSLCAITRELPSGSQVITLTKTLALSELFSSFERIIIVGGDGTFSSVLPHAIHSQALLGIVSTGTGNDLAKELGVFRHINYSSIQKYVFSLLNGQEKALDIWKLEQEHGDLILYFSNYLSFGFDAVVIESFEKLRSKAGSACQALGVTRNQAFYAISALRNMLYNLPEGIILSDRLSDRNDRQPIKGKNLGFFNIRSYLGMGLSTSNGNCTDGLLEYRLFRSLCPYFASISRHFTGQPQRTAWSAEAYTLKVPSPGLPMQKDGELCERLKPGTYRISLAGQVKVIGSYASRN